MNTNKITIYALVFTIVFFTIAASSYLKNSVYRLEKELNEINQSIQTDKEIIHVLNAEWAKLNNPERLRVLAGEHIHLNSIKGEQIINYSALPYMQESGGAKKASARQNIAAQARNNRDLRRMANSVR